MRDRESNPAAGRARFAPHPQPGLARAPPPFTTLAAMHEANDASPESDRSRGLSSRQRRFLRGLAQRLKPTVFVGDAGIGAGVLQALEQALAAHELVKVRMHAPADKKATAAELARVSGAELCGLVGHTVILYRPDPDEPRIELPRR